MNHISEIIQEGKQWIGQKEIPQNQGFVDSKFQALMNDVAFYKGASWCGFFVKLVLKHAYVDAPEIWAYLKNYVSPSTISMWLNFKRSKEIITGMIPKLGAVVVWWHADGKSGHTGIVSWVAEDGLSFKSIEGNTGISGGSNGDRVAEHLHTLHPTGMILKGFGYMPA